MKRLGLLLLLAAVPALAAQAPADSGRSAHRHAWGERSRQAREAQLRTLLGLTDDQAAKLKATTQRFQDQRRAIMKQNHAITSALRAELRPGVAASADSVRKLLDARDQQMVALEQLRRDEHRELAGYLSPVQRAQLELMRERWRGRFARMRGHRHGGAEEWGSRTDHG